MARKGETFNEDHYLGLAIRGDREGLGYLVAAYRDLAYTIAFRLVNNAEDAEEVVQDAFQKAFACLGQFRRASKFSTWLYRIVYNTALTKRSGRQRVIASLADPPDETEYANEENGGWMRLARADRKKFINLALDQLKGEDRLILTLHYIAEKSIAEVGE